MIIALCKCGCGFPVKNDRSYLSGHNVRLYLWNKGHTKETNLSVAQQANKIRKTPEKSKGIQLCACSCGKATKPGNKFINGHNRKNVCFTEEQKQSLRGPRCSLSEEHKQKLRKPHGLICEEKRKNMRKPHGPMSEEGRRNKRIAMNRPETKKKASKSAKIAANRPGAREANSKRSKEYQNRPEVKEKHSKIMEKKWKDPDYVRRQMKARSIEQNKLEKSGENLFYNLFPSEYKFVGHGEVVIDGKCPDFININGQKKIIEIWGDYWHRDDNEQDRIDIFAKFGYDTLIVWEHEFKDIETLTSKLIVFHARENPYSKHKE